MSNVYKQGGLKRATNLTVNEDLLKQAKEMGINLSSVLEQALTVVVRKKKRELWLAENQDAISAYNATLSELGVFGDETRTF